MNWSKVWIIGNGPSRKDFDFEKLRQRDETVIVINKGMFEFPWVHAFFSLDHNFIESNIEALKNFGGEVHLTVKDKSYIPLLREIKGINAFYYLRSYASGFSDEPGILCTGCNSGYCAINLAYQKHAKEIHLLGFDMNPNDQRESQYRFWAREFEYTLPQLAEKEIRVYNHNPDSFIKAYEKVEINAFNDASC